MLLNKPARVEALKLIPHIHDASLQRRGRRLPGKNTGYPKKQTAKSEGNSG
jgi:hypothetical protein